MISKRKVLVKLERPQVNLGVERISRVIELDEYGNERVDEENFLRYSLGEILFFFVNI